MRIRNITFLIIITIEIAIILFLAIYKGNHCIPGYLALGASILLFIATFWVMLFPKIEVIKPTGSYKIEYTEEFYKDESRIETYKNDGSKRELQIGIWYSKELNLNEAPLVIFSHGSFGTINNNKTLCEELASRGYVVVSVSHTYHAFETKLSNGSTIKISNEFLNEILSDDPKKNIELSLEHFKKWMDIRVKDLSFIIDTIKNNSTNHPIYKLIDTNKIIAIGHSLGGNACLGLPRYRDDISAVIALESAFMCDITGIDNNKFIFTNLEYPVPVLNIYSDSSYSHLGEWIQYEQNYKLLNSNNPKYVNKYISGIGHMHLCDFQLQSPFLSWLLSGTDSKNSAKENLSLINQYVIDFLNENNL